MKIIIQAVEAGGGLGGETFQLLNLLVRNLPIWHFQMLTGIPITGNFLMHLAILFLEFCCNSRIERLSDYRGKTQYITMQEFLFLSICVRWREGSIWGIRLT